MKITFKRTILSIKEQRRLKLLSLEKNEKELGIGFDWKLDTENDEEYEERIKIFHLFCISVVKDLFEEKFKTNEKGIIKYKRYKKDNIAIKKINTLFSIVESEKNQNG